MILAIKTGTEVTWKNADEKPPRVVCDYELFNMGAADANSSVKFTFDKPGTYHFTFSERPRLIVTLVVE